MGFEQQQQSMGAVLKEAHERASQNAGSNWRSAYPAGGGRLSMSGGGGAGSGGGGGRSRLRSDGRGRGDLGMGPEFDRRMLGASPSPGLSGNARPVQREGGGGGAVHGSSAAAAAASSPYHSGLGGVGLDTPSGGGGGGGGLPYDSFGGPGHQRERNSGGGGVRGGYISSRVIGRSPAPSLDLDELMMSGHDNTGARSDWDDVLASVSMPPQPSDGPMSPESSRG